MNHCIKEFKILIADNNSEFWTIFGTIFSGMVVFVLSQYILELIIKPYLKYRETKINISSKLMYYSNIITNPISSKDLYSEELNQTDVQNKIIKAREVKIQEINLELRNLASELRAVYYNVPKFFRKILIKDQVDKIVFILIRLSNSLVNTNINIRGKSQAILNSEDIENINKYLNLEK